MAETLDPNTEIVAGKDVHDAGITANPVTTGGRASAAAPTDVSADGDAVRAWLLRNGAQAMVLTAAGLLIPGDATNGLDVDVTRLPYDVAHDAVDSGNPVKVGARAVNALPAAVANADRSNLTTDLFGRLLVANIDPAQAIHKVFNASTTQTGIDVWAPTSGKKIAVTSVIIGTYATTAARVILWFGDNADTTYTAGTDQVLVAASFAPSATAKPGLVYTPAMPIFCTTADRELHITTDAGISIDVVVEGYEF